MASYVARNRFSVVSYFEERRIEDGEEGSEGEAEGDRGREAKSIPQL